MLGHVVTLHPDETAVADVLGFESGKPAISRRAESLEFLLQLIDERVLSAERGRGRARFYFLGRDFVGFVISAALKQGSSPACSTASDRNEDCLRPFRHQVGHPQRPGPP